MTGGPGYEVLTGELRSHSGKVSGLGERMDVAVQAAEQVAMDDSAYGVICQPFAILLQPFEEMGVQALQKAAEALRDSADKVTGAAEAYDAMEEATSADSQVIEGQV